MRFSEIVRQRLSELGLNVHQAERLYGFQTGFLRSTVRQDAKESSPTLDRAKTICDALGLEFYIGPQRDADHGSHSDSLRLVGTHALQASSLPTGVISSLAFSTAWLEGRGIVSPALVHVFDHAMGPSVPAGAVVLVDRHNIALPDKPAIFAVQWEGELMVRRLEAGEDWIALRPESPKVPSVVTHRSANGFDGLHLIGRVKAVLLTELGI